MSIRFGLPYLGERMIFDPATLGENGADVFQEPCVIIDNRGGDLGEKRQRIFFGLGYGLSPLY